MKFQKLIFIAFTIFLFSACATTYFITSDYEEEINYANFKTYDILNHDHGFPLGANQIHKQRIERAIHSEITALGFEKATDPDIEVSWFIKIKDVKDVQTYRDYYGRWISYPYSRVYEYQEGTLVVDIIDRANKQFIWHGKTSDRVYEDMPNIENKIKKAINAMITQFAKDAKLNDDYAAK